MGSPFASALGSFGDGMEQGERLRSSWDARRLRQLEQSGKSLWHGTEEVDDPTGLVGPAGQVGQLQESSMDPSAPGGPAPAGAPAVAGPAPVQAPPVPQQAEPLQTQPMGAPPPAPPQPGLQPVPMPGATPMAQADAPTPEAPVQAARTSSQDWADMNPLQQMSAVRADVTKRLRQRAQAIRTAYPDATPAEVAAALEYGVKQDRDLDPLMKMMFQSQTAELRYETLADNTDKRVGAQMRGQDINYDIRQNSDETRRRGQDFAHEDRQAAIKASLDRVRMSTTSAERRAALAGSVRLQAAELVQAGMDGRQGRMIEAQDEWRAAGIDSREAIAELKAALQAQGMSDDYISRLVLANPGLSRLATTQDEKGETTGFNRPTPAAPTLRPKPGAAARPKPGGNAELPPVAGAKKAPDGQWYVPDPKRPGKFLLVK